MLHPKENGIFQDLGECGNTDLTSEYRNRLQATTSLEEEKLIPSNLNKLGEKKAQHVPIKALLSTIFVLLEANSCLHYRVEPSSFIHYRLCTQGVCLLQL